MHVVLTPRGVETADSELKVQPALAESSSVVAESGLTMASPVDLVVTSSHSRAMISYLPGEPVAPNTVTLGADGSAELWPFDRYRS